MINDIKIPEDISNSGTIDVVRYLARLAHHANHSDPFTSCSCKRDLFLLKNLIEDLYKDLPEFPQQEEEWHQERLLELLKKTE